MQHLQKRFTTGLGWGLIDNLSGTGINFLVGILLARRLTPEVFGLVGIALLFVAVSNVIAEGGFTNALIRRRKVEEVEYSTIFLLNVGTATVLYALLFAGAPLLSLFFGQPELSAVIRCIGLSVVISSLSIVPKVRLTRELAFKPQALASLCSSLLGATVGIAMVYSGYGIWSIVAQQLVRQSTYTITLWSVTREFFPLRFSPHAARSLFAFGSRILASALIDTLYNNLYLFVIGKVFAPRTLGLYTRADQFSSLLAINFAMVLQRVSLPTLTQCKDDGEKMTRALRLIFRNSALVFSLLFATICATADHLVVAVIGPQWQDTAPILRVLCVSALFQPLIVVHQNILQVYGEATLFFRLEVTKKIIAVLTVAAALFCGFSALMWGIAFIAFVSFLINAYYGSRHLPDYPLRAQFKDVAQCHLSAAALGVITYLAGVGFSSPAIALAVQWFTAATGAILLLKFIFKTDVRRLLRRQSSF